MYLAALSYKLVTFRKPSFSLPRCARETYNNTSISASFEFPYFPSAYSTTISAFGSDNDGKVVHKKKSRETRCGERYELRGSIEENRNDIKTTTSTFGFGMDWRTVND